MILQKQVIIDQVKRNIKDNMDVYEKLTINKFQTSNFRKSINPLCLQLCANIVHSGLNMIVLGLSKTNSNICFPIGRRFTISERLKMLLLVGSPFIKPSSFTISIFWAIKMHFVICLKNKSGKGMDASIVSQ